MIQRSQSLFLLFTLIVNLLMFFIPAAEIIIPGDNSYMYYTEKVTRSINGEQCFMNYNIYSMILNIIIVLMPFVTIFIYKKRLLQIRLCVFNIILMLGMTIMMYVQTSQTSQKLEADFILKTPMIFPIVGIIFTVLALRGIIKDITLLKSYDRIR